MFLTKLFKKKETIHKYEINNAILTLEKKIKILKRASSNMNTRKKYILQSMEDIIEIFKEIDYEIYKTSYRLKDFDKETYYHMFINLIYEYLNNDKKNL